MHCPVFVMHIAGIIKSWHFACDLTSPVFSLRAQQLSYRFFLSIFFINDLTWLALLFHNLMTGQHHIPRITRDEDPSQNLFFLPSIVVVGLVVTYIYQPARVPQDLAPPGMHVDAHGVAVAWDGDGREFTEGQSNRWETGQRTCTGGVSVGITTAWALLQKAYTSLQPRLWYLGVFCSPPTPCACGHALRSAR